MSTNPYQGPQSTSTPMMQPPSSPSSGLSITAMVLGIVGIVFGCCCPLIGIPIGIAATICGVIAMNKVKQGLAGGKGMALAGLIMGIITIVLSIANFIAGLVLQMPGMMDQFQNM